MKQPEVYLRQTIDAIKPGDSLRLCGGIFPGRDETEEVEIAMHQIVPVSYMIAQSDEKTPYDNPAYEPGQEIITAPLSRNDKKLGHEPAIAIVIGVRAGKLYGIEVDLVVVGETDSLFYVTKTSSTSN